MRLLLSTIPGIGGSTDTRVDLVTGTWVAAAPNDPRTGDTAIRVPVQ